MRIVIVGASDIGVVAAHALLDAGHEVVVVEQRRERIDELTDRLDCSFVHGDGTRAVILREAGAGKADVLVTVTGDDRTNVLASVVGRHLGFPRVVLAVEDAELEELGRELGLDEVVVPCRSVGAVLRDAALGLPSADPSRLLRNGAHLFAVPIDVDHDGRGVTEIGLPAGVTPLWIHRGEGFTAVGADLALHTGDELIVLGSIDHVPQLSSLAKPDEPSPS